MRPYTLTGDESSKCGFEMSIATNMEKKKKDNSLYKTVSVNPEFSSSSVFRIKAPSHYL